MRKKLAWRGSRHGLFLFWRAYAFRRTYRMYWTHRRLGYGWQQVRWVDVVRMALAEFLDPEHLVYWRK